MDKIVCIFLQKLGKNREKEIEGKGEKRGDREFNGVEEIMYIV